MKEKFKLIEYNIEIIKMRIVKLKLPDIWNYEIINTINQLNEKLYDISDLLELIDTIDEDEQI